MNIIIFDDSEWGNPLPLSDERSIHIREVLKLESGQALRIGLLGHGIGTGYFRGIENKKLVLDFPSPENLVAAQHPLPITLVLGQPRPPVLQRLLRDLNAIGIERILVLASELSEKSYMHSKLWQDAGSYRRFLIQGAQQGGHAFLTSVERFYSVRAAIEALGPGDPTEQRMVLDRDPDGSSLLNHAASTHADSRQSILAVGPERGWTDAEREQLKRAGFGVFNLGTSILRTETACTLACGIMAMSMESTGSQGNDGY